MPYLGREPQIGNYVKLDDISSSFNGATTTFNLTSGSAAYTPGSATQLLISVGGVLQEPITAYTISGSQITFTEAPTSGASFFGIALGDVLDLGVPSDNTVSTAKIQDANVTSVKINNGAVTGSKLAAGAVSANTKLSSAVVTTHAIANNSIIPSKIKGQNNAQTGDTYTLVVSDAFKTLTMNSANTNTVTIANNATAAFNTADKVDVVMLGAGVTTVTGAAGVTVNGVLSGSGSLSQYGAASLVKINTDEWVAIGLTVA